MLRHLMLSHLKCFDFLQPLENKQTIFNIMFVIIVRV